jgi:hypothetical protein
MSRYRAEQILENLRSGHIEDYEARGQLEREYSNCSCMDGEIRRQVADVRHSYGDPSSAARRLESEHDDCEYRERRRQEEEAEERRAEERRAERRREEDRLYYEEHEQQYDEEPPSEQEQFSEEDAT